MNEEENYLKQQDELSLHHSDGQASLLSGPNVSNSGIDYIPSLSISGSVNNIEPEESKSGSIKIPGQNSYNSNKHSEEVKD